MYKDKLLKCIYEHSARIMFHTIFDQILKIKKNIDTCGVRTHAPLGIGA